MAKRHRAPIYLAFKPALAVLCAGLIGVSVYAVDVYFGFSGNAGPAEPVSGPLPRMVEPVTLETDREILSRLEQIRKPHQPIEFRDPASVRNFVNDVKELVDGSRRTPVRILHYGDSILTSDHLTSQVRNILQMKYGDGGHGFVLLGKPWIWYRHQGVAHNAWGKWRARPLTSDPLSDGLYGLGGVAFQAQPGSRGTAAYVGTATEGHVGRIARVFDISLLNQPGGGSFNVLINGELRDKVHTGSDRMEIARRRYEVSPGAARLQIAFNNDGKLRVFGVTVETGEPGIVYDSLAINGARASVLHRFDMAHWVSEINYREPSLLVLMFGANEGANPHLSVSEYENHYDGLLRKLVSGVAGASCLIMGPLDQAAGDATGQLKSRRMPVRINEVQRRVAFAHGCAFFDTWQAMGGDGSMGVWYRTGLGAGDMIHPTEAGSRRLGNWLAEALVYLVQRNRGND